MNKYMRKYLIAYSFYSEKTGKSGEGNIEIKHKTYFKDISEIEETKKIIIKAILEKDSSVISPTVIIQNIIKFPIK